MAAVAKRMKLSHVAARPSVRLNLSPLPLRLRSFGRPYATDKSSAPPSSDEAGKATGPNQDVLGHVSEEAAAVGKATGEGGPEVSQGTPIQEVGSMRVSA